MLRPPAPGDITAVVWAIRSRGASTPGCCELFAVTLRPGVDAEGRLRLETLGVQLLLVRARGRHGRCGGLVAMRGGSWEPQRQGRCGCTRARAQARVRSGCRDHRRVVRPCVQDVRCDQVKMCIAAFDVARFTLTAAAYQAGALRGTGIRRCCRCRAGRGGGV